MINVQFGLKIVNATHSLLSFLSQSQFPCKQTDFNERLSRIHSGWFSLWWGTEKGLFVLNLEQSDLECFMIQNQNKI